MGSKKFRVFIVFFVAAFLSAMIFAHRRSLTELREKSAQFESLYKTEQNTAHLSLALEHYRRESTSFRKMDPAEIAQTKSVLKAAFSADLANVAGREKIEDQLSDFLAQSAEIEKVSYSKDAYQKENIRDLHTAIANEVTALQQQTQDQIGALGQDIPVSDNRTMQIFYGSSVLVLILLFALLLENYLVFFRPLKKLHHYAALARGGQGNSKGFSANLPGIYGDIQTALSKLAENVEGHLKERHKFVRDVVADLKNPLSMLQSGRGKHGLAILSGSLDDLTDIIDINRLENRLNETTVDLTELISDVSRTFGETNQAQAVTFSLPSIPVWMKIDRRRFERVLIQVVSKVATTSNSPVHIELTELKANAGRGIEISVFDASRMRKSHSGVVPTGPELDILKHWISENGLSMALAHKVVRAHEGTINASGVNGTGVKISIRLPADRLAGNGLIMPPASTRFIPAPESII